MTDSRIPRRRLRRLWLLSTALVALAAFAVIFVAASGANLTGSTFEGNDGNLVVNTAGNTDWVNAPNLSVGQDLATGTQDNSFGQGTKEDLTDVTVVTGSIPNSKADLARFAVAGETINGQTFMYIAWSRENQSGTVNFDFEINKLAQPDLTTAGPKTLNRSTGDLLINYAFAGGSNTPTLTLRTWTAAGVWGSPASLSGCSEGLTNPAQVSENLGGLAAVNRPAQQFGEAAINLTCAGIVPQNACDSFGSAYVKSRSSTSFTSEIKDFIAPVTLHLANCGAITVTKTYKHAASGAGDHPQAGVSFTIGNVTQQTDANGQTCFSGLALGQTYTVTETVPAGYASDDASQDVAVNSAGNCTSGSTPVSFHNTPLTDISVTINSQVDGGTSSTVNCTPAGPSGSTDANGDGTFPATNLRPGTYTCTVVIDP